MKLSYNGQVPPEVIKARDASNDALKAAKELLQGELEWNQESQREADQKLDELKGHEKSKERGDWGRYKGELEEHQHRVEGWLPFLNLLEKRKEDAEELAQDVELAELIVEDFENITKHAKELKLALEEIEQPERPPESEEEEDDSAFSIPSLEALRDVTAREAILARDGGGSQVQELDSHEGLWLADLTVGELQIWLQQGDATQQDKARRALKIIKQAAAKRQKYGGKS